MAAKVEEKGSILLKPIRAVSSVLRELKLAKILVVPGRTVPAVWEKIAKIIDKNENVSWLAGGAGPVHASQNLFNENLIDLYVSGRDSENRSRIGFAQFSKLSEKVVSIQPEPVLSLGERGSFDENGTSYPSVTEIGGKLALFYTGWIKGVHVPWYNQIGLAQSEDGKAFGRVSKAPILPLTAQDHLGLGSCYVLKDGERYHMWYTRFSSWPAETSSFPHYYNIKYASSSNGTEWERLTGVCIDFKNASEYAIAKPSVIKMGNLFAMWYSYRGDYYLPGFAISGDGANWIRADDLVGIGPSPSGWDSEMFAYPHVIDGGDHFYMFYSGNSYGISGLGVARTRREDILSALTVSARRIPNFKFRAT